MTKKWKTRGIIAAVVLLVGGGAAGASLTRRIDVVVTPVVRGRAVDAVYATGTVEAERRVTVKAKTAGPIAELPVTEGDAVRHAQLLARVDDPAAAFELRRGQVEAQAAVARHAPQLATVRAKRAALESQLHAAQREMDRADRLVHTGAIGKADWDRTHDDVVELTAQLEAVRAEERAQRIDLEANAGRAQAAVRSLASKVSDADVRAPQDGVVLARYVEAGEVVAVNQPLFKVGDPAQLLLEVSIDEADIGRVHDGSTGVPSRVAASLHAFPGRTFAGHVVKVMPDADREKKSYLAKVQLDEKVDGLRSGMTAEVNIIVIEKPNALLAPADAIQDGQVWVIEDGRAVRRKVTVGIHDLLRAEILSGLAEGDRTVVGGADKLTRDGARVRVTEKAP
ncbi:efflux RND transporter periplasmic adaptor subunit [Pendulispora brunnea]|uniref:Efflux RND transporter periplasmic adaptor subunit n=1 Tax=Pendulispora brunnea TaxID=2905690 RepID=A0ABZ2K4K7_9BACT